MQFSAPIGDKVIGVVRVREGSLIVEIDGQSYPTQGVLMVAATVQAPEVAAPVAPYMFFALGDWSRSGLALAEFLCAHPPFSQMVRGMEGIISTGRLDGGFGGGCPVHDGPEPPPDDAPSPAREGE